MRFNSFCGLWIPKQMRTDHRLMSTMLWRTPWLKLGRTSMTNWPTEGHCWIKVWPFIRVHKMWVVSFGVTLSQTPAVSRKWSRYVVVCYFRVACFIFVFWPGTSDFSKWAPSYKLLSGMIRVVQSFNLASSTNWTHYCSSTTSLTDCTVINFVTDVHHLPISYLLKHIERSVRVSLFPGS